jgi:hypothetical protein
MIADCHCRIHRYVAAPEKLPPFWPTNPRAWFATVEGKFLLRDIYDAPARFYKYNCLQALPETTFILFANLVEANPLPADP